MSYEKKTWETGEVITADGLNNLEEGVQEALDCCGGAEQPIFVVNVTNPIEGEGDPTSDKTYAEIYEAYEAEKLIICRVHSQVMPGPGGPVVLKELPMAYNGVGFSYFYTYTPYIEDSGTQLVCLRVHISASDSVNVSYESYVLTPAS